MKKRRNAALILTVLFVVLTLFFFAFEVLEADHDCHGDDCLVCKIICTVASLKGAVVPALVLLALSVFAVGVCFAFSGGNVFLPAFTLISLKVKLSA